MLAQNQTQKDIIRLYDLKIPESCKVVQVTWASYRRQLAPVGTTTINLLNGALFGSLLSPVLSPYFNTEPYHYDVMLRIQCADGNVYLVLLGWGLQNPEEWELLDERDWRIVQVGMVNTPKLAEIVDKIKELQELHPPENYCALSNEKTWNCQSLTEAIVRELSKL